MKINNSVIAILASLGLALASSCGGGGGSASSSASAPPSAGRTGSLSRFTIVGDRLYSVEKNELQVFDVSRPWDPVRKGRTWVGWMVETISGHENLLLIGSPSGLYIYDTVDPDRPAQKSLLPHANARDPVIAQGNTAYYTISGSVNELGVVDIGNPSAPRLMRTYPMRRPQGLGLDGKYLFLCDGVEGLKVFDATDPMNLWEVDRVENLVPRDLIAYHDLLITTTQSGITQYSYASLPLRFLSQLGYRR